MAYNKIKVAGQSPNLNGEITVNVEHLDDVNISAIQPNQVLQYNNNQWVNANTSTLSGGTVLFIGDGTSTQYPAAAGLANNDDLQFYNLVYNGIGATGAATGWNDVITLPAGSYLCTAVAAIEFSGSTGFASYKWYDHNASAFVGTQGNVKYDTDTIGSSCSAYITSTVDVDVSVRLNANPTGIAAQNNRQAEYGYIEIRKLA